MAPGTPLGGLACCGVLGDLGIEELDAASQGPQAGRGRDGPDIPGGPQPEPPAGVDQARRGGIPQPAAEGVRSSHDQRVGLALAIGGGLDRAAAGGQPHRQRRAVAGRSGAGRAGRGPRPRGPPWSHPGGRTWRRGGGRSAWAVQPYHLFGVGMQEPGQAGAVATGALNRPHPLAWLPARQLQQLLVASWGGWHGHLLEHRAGRGDDHGGGVGVLVGVDPDGRARRCLPARPCGDSLPGRRRDGSVRTGGTPGRWRDTPACLGWSGS
jgi:hypothetical protein